MRYLHAWRSLAKDLKGSRRVSERLHAIRQQFKLKVVILRWYSLAVNQPKIMLGAYKRLQRRGHHSLSFICAQYGAYAHYWMRVLLLSWKRLVFDAPGGYLLHRETRLRRMQNFGNALFTSTTLLNRAYEVEDKDIQCSLQSREQLALEIYKEKVDELDMVKEEGKKQERERAKTENDLKCELARLQSSYDDLKVSLEREKEKVAEAEKRIQRLQTLEGVRKFAAQDTQGRALEMKGLREKLLSFPVTFDFPVIATVNNIHQIELRTFENTQKVIAPIAHRISSCKMEGEDLLAFENEGVLIGFSSEGSANLCIVAGLLAKHIKKNRADADFAGVDLNVCHKQTRDAQCQLDKAPLHEIRAANHKVGLLLRDGEDEAGESLRSEIESRSKKSIESQMQEEIRNNESQASITSTSAANKEKVLSLDQQIALMSGLQQNVTGKSEDHRKTTVHIDHEEALFGRLKTKDRTREASINYGLIEEL